MDTLRDKNYLEELWNLKKAPWKFGMNKRIKIKIFLENKKFLLQVTQV